jgi:hypothetical protein
MAVLAIGVSQGSATARPSSPTSSAVPTTTRLCSPGSGANLLQVSRWLGPSTVQITADV